MAYTANDLIPLDVLLSEIYLFAKLYRVLLDAAGDGTEPFKTVLDTVAHPSGLTSSSPAAGGTLTLDEVPSNARAAGTVYVTAITAKITVNGPSAGDSILINDVEFACVGGTPGDNEFNVGGTNTLTAENLRNAINSSTTPGIPDTIYATSSGVTVTLLVFNPEDLRNHTVYSDNNKLLPNRSLIGGVEAIRYRSFAGNVLTVEERGADETPASDHGEDAVVFFPSTTGRIGVELLKTLTGDGSTNDPGLGNDRVKVIRDLAPIYDDQREQLLAVSLAQETFERYENALSAHISKVAHEALTGQPRHSDASIQTLQALLGFYNDPVTGTLFSATVPYLFAVLYWSITRQRLDERLVSPPRTILATGTLASGTITWDYEDDLLPRYGSNSDEDNPSFGYSAQRIQMRVTAAASGATLQAIGKCQGMDGGDGLYFGRPSVASIVFSGVQAGDTITVNGVVFTANTGTLTALEFACDNTDSQCSQSFQNVLEAARDGGNEALAGVDVNSDSGVASLSTLPILDANGISNPNQTNYRLETSNASRLAISAGTLTGLTIASFGGGGPEGTSSDAEQADPRVGRVEEADLIEAEDTYADLRTFTSGKLDLATVGNTIQLVNGSSGDRVSRLLYVSGQTITGTGDGAEVVIETVEDRAVF